MSLLSELLLAEHPLGKEAAHSWTLSDTSESLLLVLAVSTISGIEWLGNGAACPTKKSLLPSGQELRQVGFKIYYLPLWPKSVLGA